ncbi:hypothetical protein HK102_007360, partial [Quaeritorhiza haematococci]
MAPIFLKVKANTNDFQAFADLDNGEDLARTWKVCTKVKDALEHGSRLENLSWRLWHLHQVMVDSNKMNVKDFKKLSSATTKKLEKDKSTQSLAARARSAARYRQPLNTITTNLNASVNSSTSGSGNCYYQQQPQRAQRELTSNHQQQAQLTQQHQQESLPRESNTISTSIDELQLQQLQLQPQRDQQQTAVSCASSIDPLSPSAEFLFDQETVQAFAQHLLSLPPDAAASFLRADPSNNLVIPPSSTGFPGSSSSTSSASSSSTFASLISPPLIHEMPTFPFNPLDFESLFDVDSAGTDSTMATANTNSVTAATPSASADATAPTGDFFEQIGAGLDGSLSLFDTLMMQPQQQPQQDMTQDVEMQQQQQQLPSWFADSLIIPNATTAPNTSSTSSNTNTGSINLLSTNPLPAAHDDASAAPVTFMQDVLPTSPVTIDAPAAPAPAPATTASEPAQLQPKPSSKNLNRPQENVAAPVSSSRKSGKGTHGQRGRPPKYPKQKPQPQQQQQDRKGESVRAFVEAPKIHQQQQPQKREERQNVGMNDMMEVLDFSASLPGVVGKTPAPHQSLRPEHQQQHESAPRKEQTRSSCPPTTSSKLSSSSSSTCCNHAPIPTSSAVMPPKSQAITTPIPSPTLSSSSSTTSASATKSSSSTTTSKPRTARGGIECQNCGVTSTPLWRRSADDKTLCNACGLYYKLHHVHRPKDMRPHLSRKLGGGSNPDGSDGGIGAGTGIIAPVVECFNCRTRNTPLWRRDEEGRPLCNACGLYFKLHNEKRPLSMKTDVIRKRQRYDASTNGPRPSSSSQSGNGSATGAGSAGTGGSNVPSDKAMAPRKKKQKVGPGPGKD